MSNVVPDPNSGMLDIMKMNHCKDGHEWSVRQSFNFFNQAEYFKYECLKCHRIRYIKRLSGGLEDEVDESEFILRFREMREFQ